MEGTTEEAKTVFGLDDDEDKNAGDLQPRDSLNTPVLFSNIMSTVMSSSSDFQSLQDNLFLPLQ